MREPGGKRDLMKSEAIRLFVAHGVDAASARDIAAACDMKSSNLRADFASKEALAADLFHTGYREYGAILQEAAAGTVPFRVRAARAQEARAPGYRLAALSSPASPCRSSIRTGPSWPWHAASRQ